MHHYNLPFPKRFLEFLEQYTCKHNSKLHVLNNLPEDLEDDESDTKKDCKKKIVKKIGVFLGKAVENTIFARFTTRETPKPVSQLFGFTSERDGHTRTAGQRFV